jgi:HD-GYP domain-containing protein (c-di-GMP phosphodiesterase class II)
MPLEVLNKPSYLSEDEWKIMHKHPFWGALSILTLKGIDDVSIQNAIAAFQHHMHCDYSGYPKVRDELPLSFYTKIISIADQYDAMTSSRIYMKNPLSPDKTLGIMLERSGTQIDPILFKFFINMVGNFPIGSLVLLDTREMGLVYEGSHYMADRPRVMIIVDSSGTKIDGTVIDLTERDSSGKFLKSIVKTLDPKEYNISLADYLL